MPTKKEPSARSQGCAAAEIMNPFVESVRPRASVQEAAVRMRAFDVGLLPVLQNGEVLGVVTDRDLVLRAIAEGRPLLQTPVEALMTRNPIVLVDSQSVDSALRVLELNRIRRVPVSDAEGRLQGIIGLADFLQHGHEAEALSLWSSIVSPSSCYSALPLLL